MTYCVTSCLLNLLPLEFWQSPVSARQLSKLVAWVVARHSGTRGPERPKPPSCSSGLRRRTMRPARLFWSLVLLGLLVLCTAGRDYYKVRSRRAERLAQFLASQACLASGLPRKLAGTPSSGRFRQRWCTCIRRHINSSALNHPG